MEALICHFKIIAGEIARLNNATTRKRQRRTGLLRQRQRPMRPSVYASQADLHLLPGIPQNGGGATLSDSIMIMSSLSSRLPPTGELDSKTSLIVPLLQLSQGIIRLRLGLGIVFVALCSAFGAEPIEGYSVVIR